MIGIIIRPMLRGQITLPKKYREKLGITPETPLNVTLEQDAIVVKPLHELIPQPVQSPTIIKATLSKKQYLKKLKQMRQIRTPLWTKEDDIRKKEMERKERWG